MHLFLIYLSFIQPYIQGLYHSRYMKAVPLIVSMVEGDRSQSREEVKIRMHAAARPSHQNSPSYQQIEVILLYFLSKAVSYKINSFQSEWPNMQYASFWHVYSSTTLDRKIKIRKISGLCVDNKHWLHRHFSYFSSPRTWLSVCMLNVTGYY